MGTDIHWAATDGASGDLVSWGTGSTLATVVGQIADVRRDYRGWLEIRQLPTGLETMQDLRSFPRRPVAQARIARFENALDELETAATTALDRGVPAADLVSRLLKIDPLRGLRDLIPPGGPR